MSEKAKTNSSATGSSSSHEHHHHHHHHRIDAATKFKRNSLKAIERQKKMEKWAHIALIVLAIVMGIAVVVAYMFN